MPFHAECQGEEAETGKCGQAFMDEEIEDEKHNEN
jgi:hypothetical protein